MASAEQDEERTQLEKELTVKQVKRDLACAKYVCDYVDTFVQLLMLTLYHVQISSINLCTSAS